MIRPININLNAAHPELPLVEATTFTGAPSSVFIRGVPKAVGNWSITAVSVAVTYPDNTTTARAAVESAEGVWVATIPGTATSGRTAAGFKIMADGIDENGAAVTGYVLGFADFSVLSFTPVPAPGGTFYLLRYFDQAPATPKEGDVAKIDGVLKFYNSSAWETFAASVTLDDAVTRTSGNGVKSSGIWSAIWGSLAALPAGFTSLYGWCVSQLAGKASKADATLTERFSEWTFTKSLTAADKAALYAENPLAAENDYALSIRHEDSDYYLYVGEYQTAMLGSSDGFLSCYLDHVASEAILNVWEQDIETVATRAALQGYQLGSQSDMPLASEAEAEALRTGKQDALSAQQLANIAAVPNKADVSAIPYTLGTPIVIDTASSETVEGETVNYGAATLANRTANQVFVVVALDELRVTIPPAVLGKVRDFGLLVAVGADQTALAAPALVPVAPTGETITMMNAEGEMPTLADGTTTSTGSTVLYFTEVANGVFLVKGEQVEEVA